MRISEQTSFAVTIVLESSAEVIGVFKAIDTDNPPISFSSEVQEEAARQFDTRLQQILLDHDIDVYNL